MWVKLSLKWTAVFWQYTHFFYQDLCYEEMPLLLSCPFHQVRRVGNTQKCSINKCTLFCLAKLQYKYFLTHPVFTPPSHLLLLCVTAGASQARPETIEPLGIQPRLQVVTVDTGQQGAFLKDLAALVSRGRALIRTGDCSLRDKIFIFPECRRRMRCHASISYTVAPENIPIFIQKFFISVQQVICAFKSI